MRRRNRTNNFSLSLLTALVLTGLQFVCAQEIEPTWESMAENYKVPEWFLDGKIGVWMHWGPSSVEDRPEGIAFDKLIPLFKAEKWDPDALVKFFKDNGARFIMPMACHHNNFDMYDSFNPWNSVKMGPKRDVVQEWKNAAVKYGLKFGVSSHLYWSPLYWKDVRKDQKPGTPEWALYNMDYSPTDYASQASWNEHWYARCWEIIEKYDPDMFNNDISGNHMSGKGLELKLFSDYLNRDLKENNGKQTVVLSSKFAQVNRAAFTYNMERGSSGGVIQPEPWIWATDLSGSWSYQKGAVNKMSIPVMIGNAIDVISKNGVAMLNVALRGDGTLPENQAAYLRAFGEVLRTNAEGIYGSRPWKIYGEGPQDLRTGHHEENLKDYSQEDIRFTIRDGNLYAFVLAKPTKDIVIKTLKDKGVLDRKIKNISMMGSDENIKWKRTTEGLSIQLPKTLPEQAVIGFQIMLK